jgi:hypothetical protein
LAQAKVRLATAAPSSGAHLWQVLGNEQNREITRARKSQEYEYIKRFAELNGLRAVKKSHALDRSNLTPKPLFYFDVI